MRRACGEQSRTIGGKHNALSSEALAEEGVWNGKIKLIIFLP
jgi:hypothetical protein